jgi:hypothetical protein
MPSRNSATGARRARDASALTAWQRLKDLGRDPRLSTELGRLNFAGKLNDTQMAAGFEVGKIYCESGQVIDAPRRSAASPHKRMRGQSTLPPLTKSGLLRSSAGESGLTRS